MLSLRFNTANEEELCELLADSDQTEELEEIENDEEYDQHDIEVLKSLGKSNLKDFKNRAMQLVDQAPFDTPFDVLSSLFVKVKCNDGKMNFLKKETVIWYFEQGIRRMSNDHNVRFTQTSSYVQQRRVVVKDEVEERNLRIGDRCLFQSLNDEEKQIVFFL